MASVNEELVDRSITRGLTLARFSAGEKNAVLRQLDALERHLVATLEKANLTSFKRERVTRLLAQTRQLIRQSYRTIRDNEIEAMTELAGNEATWTTSSINATVGVALTSVAWTPEFLRSIASNVLIEGAPSATWWAKQAGDLQRRFADTVRQGLLKGDTTEQIVRAIRGTQANNYTDGIMSLSRAQATSLVRTSVSTVAQETRMQTLQANSDVVKGIVWLSVLDARTSLYCIPRSQKLYTLDHQPIGHNLPWDGGPGKIHWQCRSQAAPALKSWQELAGKQLPQADDATIDELFRENLRKRGWSEERIAAARRNQQASMDGQIPDETTYEEWLRKQPVSRQDEVLGPTRAKLFRSGVISNLSQLVSQEGQPLLVSTLKQRYPLATAAA